VSDEREAEREDDRILDEMRQKVKAYGAAASALSGARLRVRLEEIAAAGADLEPARVWRQVSQDYARLAHDLRHRMKQLEGLLEAGQDLIAVYGRAEAAAAQHARERAVEVEGLTAKVRGLTAKVEGLETALRERRAAQPDRRPLGPARRVRLYTNATDAELAKVMYKLRRHGEKRNGGGLLTISGYDADPRELWDIPEVQVFCARLWEIGFCSLLLPSALLELVGEPVFTEVRPGGGMGAYEVWRMSRGECKLGRNSIDKEEFLHWMDRDWTDGNERADAFLVSHGYPAAPDPETGD
jgi:hypothetical protein